ncbi:glycosyltransferase family 39 protein [Lentisphaerota bacterium ZTH]|nr:glycosyltransferase family 39 protein [Lentisphaerota bacterium]WET06394.1 glycosyltransferase family 39 protein [Lentisphaerota bacterium ZTH]
MAEAFARGNFSMALHSRFLPLYTILSGICCLVLNVSGYFACKLTSLIAFSLSVIPIYYITKTITGKRITSILSAYLLIFCYPLIASIGGGTRANLKAFLLTCTAWAFIEAWQSAKLRYFLYCALATAGLTLTRGDCALFSIAVMGTLVIRGLFFRRRIVSSVIAVAVFTGILAPWLCYQYLNIGYPVPEVRHGIILSQLTKHLPYIDIMHNKNPSLSCKPSLNQFDQLKLKYAVSADTAKEHPARPETSSVNPSAREAGYKNSVLYQFCMKFLKGLYPFYFVLAFLGIILRLRNGKWNRLETVLLSLYVFHNLTIVGQILIADHKLYTSSRYLLVAVPLYLPWTATAFETVYIKLKRNLHRLGLVIFAAICLIIIIISYSQGTKELIHERFQPAHSGSRDLKIIAGIINSKNIPKISGVHSAFECNFYLSPTIVTKEVSLGYYTNCNVITAASALSNIPLTNQLIKENVIRYLVLRPEKAEPLHILKDQKFIKEIYSGRKYTLWEVRSNP